MFDFDQIIDRRGTDCVKYDTMGERDPSTIPMFVADMDFACAPAIRAALARVVYQGIYGYTVRPAGYFDAIAGWYARRYGWELKPEWLLTTPGVVHALNVAVRAYTEPGDAVLILTPVYGPFGQAILGNGRVRADCPLIREGNRYRIDFAEMERTIVERGVKLFLFCSPHNPIGRVWTREEHERIGAICLRHGVTVIADEIHSDFVFGGHKHLNFAALSPELAEITVTCTAPSKTFNLAGLENSNIFIPNAALREKFAAQMAKGNTPAPNIFAYAATVAAYNEGDAWLDELLAYLEQSRDMLVDFFAASLPKARITDLEGTYLVWADLSAYGNHEQVREKLDAARVWLSDDTAFCTQGSGYWRINIATPRAVLREALERMAKELK